MSKLEACIVCKSTKARIIGLEKEREENLRTIQRVNETNRALRERLKAERQELKRLQSAWDNRNGRKKK